MEHEALHCFTSREKPLLLILYVFSALFITTLTAGVKTRDKQTKIFTSHELKTPQGRVWDWKRKRNEWKGDGGSVMGCCCSVLGMIKQWGWLRALNYDKHMHTHTDALTHTQTHTLASLAYHWCTCPSMDGVDCRALTHPWLHLEPWGASDWHGDTNGVKQASCWKWQI